VLLLRATPTGRVAGFKFGTPPNPQELLEMLIEFPHLQKLVFHAGTENVSIEIPSAIGALESLRFVSLSGNIKKLPQEILRLNLPIVVLEHTDDLSSVDYQRQLNNATGILLRSFRSEDTPAAIEAGRPPLHEREDLQLLTPEERAENRACRRRPDRYFLKLCEN
jgi:hypothetical protein